MGKIAENIYKKKIDGHRIILTLVLCLFGLCLVFAMTAPSKRSKKKAQHDSRVYLVHSDELRYDQYSSVLKEMKTELILVGKTVNKHFVAGIKDYAERITHYMPFNITTIPELKNTKSLSEQQQKEREGELILKQIQPSDTVVLMDEHGQEFRSIEFAKWIERKQATARRLVFVIGGPYGFSQAVYDRANEKISLSKMTFSHQMVRLIFTEALYRACTIIKGEPYHHE